MRTTPTAPDPRRPRIAREVALSALLAVLGAAALVHESAWFRLLVPWLGAGVAPAAVVSAGALLGFTIGAAVGGRASDRTRFPARVLAVAEALAAAASIAVPAALEALSGLRGPAALGAATLVVTLAATPMGASLPAAVRALAPGRERVATVFRRLYGWSTFGALLGVLAAAALLLEALGNRGAIGAASLAQAVVAGLALALPAVEPPAAAPGAAAAKAPAGARWRLVAALCGAAGLVIQIAWIRRLTVVLGSTYQVFAAVLGVHLLALAVGPWIFGPRRDGDARRGALVVALVSAALAAASPWFTAHVGRFAAAALRSGDGSFAGQLAIRAVAAALVVLPSTVVGAALLAWCVRLSEPDADAAGRTTGSLLAANCAGSAVAALGVAVVWIPLSGTAAALTGAGGLYALCGALVVTHAGSRAALVGLALLAFAPTIFPLADRGLERSIGVLYAPGSYDPGDGETVFLREGAISTVAIRDRDGRREFWVDGSIESSTGPTDRLHLALLGHLPMALRAAAGGVTDRVAVIGLGAGFTAQAVAAWSPRETWIFELEPAVAAAAGLMVDDGGGVPAGARVVLADGRRGLVDAGGLFDVVTTDPIHPAVAGSASLYSLEAYRSVAGHLAAGGIFCQWLPIGQMDEADVRLVARTFAAAFASPYLFAAGADGILIGTSSPLRLDEGRLRAALAAAPGAGLADVGLRSPGGLLSLLARHSVGFEFLAGAGHELNTDDRLLLEFRCGRHAGVADGAGFARRLGTERPDAASLLVGGSASREFHAEAAAQAPFLAGLASWVERDFGTAARFFADAANASPDARLLARLRDEATIEAGYAFLAYGRAKEAGDIAMGVLERGGADAILRLDAADLLRAAGRRAEARAAATAVVRAGTDSPRARRLASLDAD